MRTIASFILLLATVIPFSPGAAARAGTPLSALDPRAEISGVFAFRSYDLSATPRVTLIMCVDRLLEPAHGPSWFPFDPDVLYEIKVDNNNDAVADIRFQFRFKTEQRLPDFFQAYAGAGSGLIAPANSPAPVAPGTEIVPARIASFDSPGFGQLQSYTVTMVKGVRKTSIKGASPFHAVPVNVGPRTMDYAALFAAGTYTTTTPDVKVFAGAVDDPVYADLGGLFDTTNFRSAVSGGFLSPAQDAAQQNGASDMHSGYAVNAIAIEVPVKMLTRTGADEPASSTNATIGVWATTSRRAVTTRRSPSPPSNIGGWRQVSRMGNPLMRDLLIGTRSKDRFGLDQPKKDSQFASYFSDPLLARVYNAATSGAVAIPPPPRDDLLPLLTYAPPIAADGTKAGPTADLLRLNTGVGFVLPGNASRLGVIGGDTAGYPNGRRLFDDVLDITLRVVAGGVINPTFNVFPNNTLGDGVNVNDASYRTTFPYLGDCPSGRDRRHLDPGESGGGAP